MTFTSSVAFVASYENERHSLGVRQRGQGWGALNKVGEIEFPCENCGQTRATLGRVIMLFRVTSTRTIVVALRFVCRSRWSASKRRSLGFFWRRVTRDRSRATSVSLRASISRQRLTASSPEPRWPTCPIRRMHIIRRDRERLDIHILHIHIINGHINTPISKCSNSNKQLQLQVDSR